MDKKAETDKDIAFLVRNMDSEAARDMLGMVADSPFALSLVLRRARELQDNQKITPGQFDQFSKRLHDVAVGKGTIEQGQRIVAHPISKKEAGEAPSGYFAAQVNQMLDLNPDQVIDHTERSVRFEWIKESEIGLMAQIAAGFLAHKKAPKNKVLQFLTSLREVTKTYPSAAGAVDEAIKQVEATQE